MPVNGFSFNKNTFFVITGASKGIGATIAIECSKKFTNGSKMLLVARSATGLESTKQSILKNNPNLDVVTHSIDLSAPKVDELTNMLKNSLPSQGSSAFEQALIVHNVGTTGDVSKKVKECSDVREWQENFNCNVFGVILLNNIFLKIFNDIPKYVVNITSKVAIVPFAGVSFYGPNKAAREMYFRGLAEEEKEDPLLLGILNYSPGPVKTDMLQSISQQTISQSFREFIHENQDTGLILTTTQTAQRLLEVIEKGGFESGAHVDYFDG